MVQSDIGKFVTLTDGTTNRRSKVFMIPHNTVIAPNTEKNVIKVATKKHRDKLCLGFRTRIWGILYHYFKLLTGITTWIICHYYKLLEITALFTSYYYSDYSIITSYYIYLKTITTYHSLILLHGHFI
jgi:hypothetical protein